MRWSEAILFLTGLWLLLAPDGWGWAAAAEVFGEGRLLRFGLGVTLLLGAVLVAEKNRMRGHMRQLIDALNRILYGENYAREREAVDLLLRAASASSSDVRAKAIESLEQVTGESFGDDIEAWRSWWEGRRSTFSMPRRTEPEDGPGA